jgi:hypothetical protein
MRSEGETMKIFRSSFVFIILVLQSSLCFSQYAANIIVVPDPMYSAHQFGVETAVTMKSKLGILAAYKRDSDRPTYGDSNDSVSNTFSRILLPWRYSKNGAWENGFFVTGLAGVENDKFKSVSGSRAEVTFINLGVLAGYQWFWRNGFNISAMLGGALLIENSSTKDISANEKSAVSEYLNKNTKTNSHVAGGVMFGWAF